MAAGAGSAAKENAPPPPPTTSGATAAASAVAAAASRCRRRGYAVKSCGGGVKKPAGRARLLGRRVPLRDITNLIRAAVSGPDEASLGQEQEVPPAAATELAEPDAVVVVRLAAMWGGGVDAAAGPAAKPARYSLRKGFR